MTDEMPEREPRLGDREDFPEWMDQIMGELEERKQRVEDVTTGPLGQPIPVPVSGQDDDDEGGVRTHRRFLRWFFR